MAEEDAAAGTRQPQDSKQQFAIRKIYLRDVSFEVPNAPAIFAGEWKPEVNVDLDTRTTKIAESSYETVVRITVTAKQGEKTAYLCEVEQAGVFALSGFDDKTLETLLGTYCPAQLFPYAREAVSDVVTKGGFPQMVLAPVNFEALYMQRRREQQEQQQGERGSGGDTQAGQNSSTSAN